MDATPRNPATRPIPDSHTGDPGWLQSFLLLLATAYAVLLIRFPNPFFADDSFFYLQIGRNVALGYGSTFNRLMPTNGYHPLWMLVCALVYRLVPGRSAGLHAIAVVIVLLNLAVLLLAQRLLHRLGASAWIAWTILIPFLFGLQLGTESSLSAAMLAATLLLLERYLERPTWTFTIAFHCAAILAVLSRLDSIFVIACLWIAVLVWATQQANRKILRRYLALIPLYAVVWGGYLLSNIVWFHTIMPISGLLKSSNAGDHRFGQNLPHTALIALAISAISLMILWRKQRDRWLLYAELPFFAGIGMHAIYITLRMTSETRWTWYYVSWALLAALTAARAGTCLLREMRWGAMLRTAAMVGAVLVSLALWYRMGWKHSKHEKQAWPAMAFEQSVEGQDHIHSLLAYDMPGGMAYYSDVSIVPLDGLMGNLPYQQELALHGIWGFIHKDHIEAFAGPSIPFDAWAKRTYCDAVFLESTRFTCQPIANGQWTITGVEVYSRLPFQPAGYIPLPASQILWTRPDYITVWRIADPEKEPGK
ncbi:MAG TPA: hypothetical protein VHX63_14485 [Acidobacteriaceae bacterium]|jgi:hypothetical protein|nr:hypothetical protein [Acidobacteriaceae bacterium]